MKGKAAQNRVTKATPFEEAPAHAPLFEVRAGVDATLVEQYADMLLDAARDLMGDIISAPDEGVNRAFLVLSTITQAQACYRATGAAK